MSQDAPTPSIGAAAAVRQPDGCPVDHSKFKRPAAPSPMLTPPPQQGCDSSAMDSAPPSAAAALGGGCPVDHGRGAPSAQAQSKFDGAAVVGDNFPDASPQPHQSRALSTAAIASSIPKGGPDVPEGSTWIFPSPQRFYNAMSKKGWQPREEDMAWVVGIHNTVNETTWRKVLEFERMHADSCPQPKLLRFRGRPADLSPKARILGWMGYVAPFDRHDWVVDRCGKEVRYVIDFYSGASSGLAMDLGGMPPAIHVDVRPALTPSGAWDRLRWNWNKWMGGGK